MAEVSFKNSKLPPRMQAYVDDKRRREEENLESTEPSNDNNSMLFSFAPLRARSVPDFRRLQKAFITKMEQLKKSKNPVLRLFWYRHEARRLSYSQGPPLGGIASNECLSKGAYCLAICGRLG
jgi:hypothetical protein